MVNSKLKSLKDQDDLGFEPLNVQDDLGFEPLDTQDDLGFEPLAEPKQELEGEITQQELDNIAKKHNLSEQQAKSLQENLAFFGTKVKGTTQSPLDQAPGFIADAVGLGLPQKYVIETAETEELKNALDDLRQLAESRKSIARTASEIGAGLLVPGFGVARAAKLGTKAAKAAQAGIAAGVPATELAARSKRGEELKGAAIGATAGLALGVAAPKLLKAAKETKDKWLFEAVEKQLKDMPNLDKELDNKLLQNKPKYDVERLALKGQQLTPDEMETYLGKDIANKARELGGQEAVEQAAEAKLITRLEEFEKFAKKSIEELEREGGDFVERQYDRFLKDEMAPAVVAENSIRGSIPVMLQWKEWALKFSDNKPIAKIIDSRLGTNVETLLEDMSQSHNQYTVGLGQSLPEITKLKTLTRKAGTSPQEVYEALDTGKSGNVPKQVISAWKNFFEEQRQHAISMGLPIPKRENYVPKRRLSPIKYMAAIEKKGNDLQSATGYNIRNLSPSEFLDLSRNKEFKPLIRELEFMGGGTVNSASDFNLAYNTLLTNPRQVRGALALDAFAAKARTEGEIPDFVLDKDIGNLASKWTQSTFRSIALRDGLAELDRYAKLADKAGDVWAHRFLTNLSQDIIGSRTGTLASGTQDLANRIIAKAEVNAEKATSAPERMMYKGMAVAPNVMNAMMRQVYPNYLGLNPKSILQNIASPITFIIPDMGVGYGSVKYLQSLKDIIDTKTVGKTVNLSESMARKLNTELTQKKMFGLLNKVPKSLRKQAEKEGGFRAGQSLKTTDLNLIMQNQGLLPQQWTGEMVDALQDGIKSSAIGDMSRKALDTYTDGMMYLFEKSEIAARANAYFMGQRIGKDLVSNPKWARKFIARIDSPAYQRRFLEVVKEGDVEKAQELMSKYINGNNMFNYDRINMSDYGRIMGPMFSVFSKWPTSIAGRIMSNYERKGAYRGSGQTAATLLLPYLGLQVIDNLTRSDSDLYNKLIGRSGLSGWTAFDSAVSLTEGGILQSPALDTLGDLAGAVHGQGISPGQDMDKRLQKINKATQEAINTYGPGSGLLRFLGEDIPIYRGKPKPTGPKIERRIKSIKQQLK